MATSVFMSATLPDHNNTSKNPNNRNPSMLTSLEEHPDHHHHQQQPVPRCSSSGSRRKKAAPARGSTSDQQQQQQQKKKKQPQRGMGIAKLEQIIHPQIRLTTSFKKMGASPTTSHEILTSTCAAFDHVPVHQFPCSKMGLRTRNKELQQGYINYLGFHHDHGPLMGAAGVVGAGLTVTTTTNHQSDLLGVRPCFNNSCFGDHHKVIKDHLLISSTPNAYVKSCYNNPLDNCNACNKKKKLVNGENMGAGVVKSDAYTQVMSNFVDSGLFLGSNVGDIHHNMIMLNDQENQGFATKPPWIPPPNYNLEYAAHHLPNVKQAVEIVAVHRKESSGSEYQGAVLMEYEFFPAAAKTTSDDDDHYSVMMEPPSCCGDQGRVAHGGGGGGASNLSSSSIDLSLKLSY